MRSAAATSLRLTQNLPVPLGPAADAAALGRPGVWRDGVGGVGFWRNVGTSGATGSPAELFRGGGEVVMARLPNARQGARQAGKAGKRARAGDGRGAEGGADAGSTSATASADGGAAVGTDAGSTSATASADMATVEGFDVTDEAGESAEMAAVSRLEAEAEAGSTLNLDS